MITDVGITASRHGLSEIQRRILVAFLHRARLAGADRFHHGKCTGGDEIGAQIAHNLGYRVIAHPLFTLDVIDGLNLLIALPRNAEVAESNAWVSIRYARDRRLPRLVVLPSGIVVDRVGVDDLHLVTTGEYAAGPVTTDQRIKNHT